MEQKRETDGTHKIPATEVGIDDEILSHETGQWETVETVVWSFGEVFYYDRWDVLIDTAPEDSDVWVRRMD